MWLRLTKLAPRPSRAASCEGILLGSWLGWVVLGVFLVRKVQQEGERRIASNMCAPWLCHSYIVSRREVVGVCASVSLNHHAYQLHVP